MNFNPLSYFPQGGKDRQLFVFFLRPILFSISVFVNLIILSPLDSRSLRETGKGVLFILILNLSIFILKISKLRLLRED